jgi:hypothetical protein
MLEIKVLISCLIYCFLFIKITCFFVAIVFVVAAAVVADPFDQYYIPFLLLS